MSNDNTLDKIDPGFLENVLIKNNENKIDVKKLSENPTPPAKYKIINDRKLEDHKRDVLSPEIEESEVVLQSTYSLAGKEFGKRYLVTFGVGQCVVATLYDPTSKTGAMAHFDHRSNVIVTMREIERRLGGNPQDWQLRIVGGYKQWESSKAIVRDLRSEAAFSRIFIAEEDVLGEFARTRRGVAVALDTETGELLDLLTNYYKDRFTREQKHRVSMERMRIAKDPMISIGKVEFLPNLLGKK